MNSGSRKAAVPPPNFHDYINLLVGDLVSDFNTVRLTEFLEAMTRGMSIGLATIDAEADMEEIRETLIESIKKESTSAYHKVREEGQTILTLPTGLILPPGHG